MTAHTGRRASRNRRPPYAWLGAGALTLGVGVALAGAGAAQAEDTSAADSSTSADAGPVSDKSSTKERPGDSATASDDKTSDDDASDTEESEETASDDTASDTEPSDDAVPEETTSDTDTSDGETSDSETSADSAAQVDSPATTPPPVTSTPEPPQATTETSPPASSADSATAAPAPETTPSATDATTKTPAQEPVAETQTPAVAYVSQPATWANPADYGPALGTLVRIVNEIRYVMVGLKPTLTPFQLPSAPNQSVIVGTLGAYTLNRDPFTITVTTAPTNGTVTIDATSGAYVYSPNAALAATGGTDTFTVTATDTGHHPLADLLGHLFGLAPHSTTVVVPVTVTAAQPATDTDTGTDTGATAYYITNTSYQAMQIAGYAINQASLSPAIGQVIQSPATASDSGQTQALFELADGQTVTVYLNPVGVIHEGVVQNYAVKNAGPLAISPDGIHLYSLDPDDNAVEVINTATGITTATIPVGGFPDGIAITSDGSRVYVSNEADSTVSVIDTASNLVIATISVGAAPRGIAVTADGEYAYVANAGSHTVSVISTNPVAAEYNSTIATISLDSEPYLLTVSPDGTRVYVTSAVVGTVSVIETASNTVMTTVSVADAFGVAVSPDSSRIYVTSGTSNSVTVLDAATLAVEATIAVIEPNSVAVSPDGKQIYVTSNYSSVAVIDTDTASPDYNTVVSTIAVGDGVFYVIAGADGNTAYSANYGDSTVSKLSAAPSGTSSDGGTWGYVVTMTGGSTPTCTAAGSTQCATADTNTITEDAPGTIYHIPSDQAQEQSDVLQNLVSDDMSNATFYTKSEPTIGYTNAMIANGFSPYANNTSNPSTSNFAATTTTSTASSSTWNVTQKVTEEEKMGNLTLKAEESASYTWGTTTTNTLTYTQTVTQTVDPGETLYLYTETPVYRFYGDWSVVYGNTTYNLEDVWYDTPYAASSLYPSYMAAYTCQTGSAQCSQLASGDLSAYPDPFPANGPTYPVAESDTDSSYDSSTSEV
ncbi:hypothetical protein BH11ACT7_BH11ACT7_05340 [soil metagenome]